MGVCLKPLFITEKKYSLLKCIHFSDLDVICTFWIKVMKFLVLFILFRKNKNKLWKNGNIYSICTMFLTKLF